MSTPIIRNVIKWLNPFIVAFGLYVVVFGHLSPGGGFAGGSIIAAGLILDRYANGKSRLPLSSYRLFQWIGGSLFLYGAIKGYSFIVGAHAWHPLLGKLGDVFSAGWIPLLNIFVGLVVALTFYGLYSLFEEGSIQ